MGRHESSQKVTTQQQRILRLLFKFRFVSAGLLADSMGIRRNGVYQALEKLVDTGFVTKVYEEQWRIDRRPAYYYLSKSGVTKVRRLMDVEESVVHALYKNDTASEDFIKHCLQQIQCYASITQSVPKGIDIFSKTEINRFDQFPRTRPDLYIRTPGGNEAMVLIFDEETLYKARKYLQEAIDHSEDEGWPSGTYPRICLILRNENAVQRFLRSAAALRERIGFEDDELPILAAPIGAFTEPSATPWRSANNPKKNIELFAPVTEESTEDVGVQGL